MKNIGSLTVTLPSDREIALARSFDAPRHLVFKALTTPDLLKQWLTGAPGWTMEVCEIDLQVGGVYRFVWRSPEGVEMGMGGVYLEVVAPERYSGTEVFDQAWYDGEAIATTVLTDQGNTTDLSITVRYDSKEIRDAVLQSPMADGMSASYEQLAKLLSTMQSQQ